MHVASHDEILASELGTRQCTDEEVSLLPSLDTHLLRARSALFAAKIIGFVIGRLSVLRVADDFRRPLE